MPKPYRLFLPCIAVAISVATMPIALSQSPGNYGTLRGVVVDASKASVPSAIITLTNQLTAVERATSSDSGGAFQLNGIPFGTYQIIASAAGFRKYPRNLSTS